MSHDHEVNITTRDRLMRAWENSMELVRDFKSYSKEMENDGERNEDHNQAIKNIFDEFAVDEGIHAAKFRELLIKYDDKYQ